MRSDLPISLSDWEEALTRRFLTAAGEGVGPIRSFDISPETLALRDWLACQALAGRPFRKLVLPDDDGWVQIG